MRFALVSLALLTAACAPVEREATLSLDLGEDTSALEGLSRSAAGTLWVMTAEQLHELDADGARLRGIDLSALQPEGDRFRDVLDLGDGTFAASHTRAVARLFPDEGYSEDYFCLEPGSFEPTPVEPTEPEPGPLTRINAALSADLDADRIYAAPRAFQDGVLIDNKLVEYTVSGGEFLRALPLEGYRPEAIAVRGNIAVLLEDDRLSRVDISGRAVETLESRSLDGVTDAVGAALDGDRLLVLDGARREIAVFVD